MLWIPVYTGMTNVMSDQKINLKEFLKNQISLTEWYERSGSSLAEEFRLEDKEKRERLKVLNEIIGLPFDKPTQFIALDLEKQTPKFKRFLKENQNELCAIQLIPLDSKLPKLRMRGVTVLESIDWYKNQNIDPEKYRIDYIPHSNNQLFSIILVVNSKGIFGEIIKGGAYQLTQGFYDSGEPITFAFDFKNWQFSENNNNMQKAAQEFISLIKITDKDIQAKLTKKLKTQFVNNYMVGYFEALSTKEHGIWYIDYNRILGDQLKDYEVLIQNTPTEHIKGFIGSPGKIQGKVRLILETDLTDCTIEEGEILVCPMTTPAHLPLMKQSAAIVTDLGGILSHAAIISRELKIPCITATKVATQRLKTGDLIEVDAETGVVKIL